MSEQKQAYSLGRFVKEGNYEELKKYLEQFKEQGALDNLLEKKENKVMSDMDSMFWYAAQYNNENTIQIMELLKDYGANINILDTCGVNTFMIAAEANNVPVMEKLYGWGVDIDHGDSGMHRAMFYAVSGDAVDSIDFLVSKGISVDFQDIGGRTALHDSASLGKEKAAEKLMSLGADPTIEDFTEESTIAAELVPAGEDWDEFAEKMATYYKTYKEQQKNKLKVKP